jgi:hypothetical protein
VYDHQLSVLRSVQVDFDGLRTDFNSVPDGRNRVLRSHAPGSAVAYDANLSAGSKHP